MFAYKECNRAVKEQKNKFEIVSELYKKKFKKAQIGTSAPLVGVSPSIRPLPSISLHLTLGLLFPSQESYYPFVMGWL